MAITNLPPEILARIFSCIEGKDLAGVSCTCKSFHRAVQIDFVWKIRCQKEYLESGLLQDNLAWKDIFWKLLHPYGFILGWWQMSRGHYGGLLHVQYSDGKIMGTQYLPPPDPHIQQPMRQKMLFLLSLQADGSVVFNCQRSLRETEAHESCSLMITKERDSEKPCFRYKCCEYVAGAQRNGTQEDFFQWLQEELGNPDQITLQGHELYFMKYLVLLQYDCEMSFHKIDLPMPPTYPVPIRPGLFKGTYGPHGVEVILLKYDFKKDEAHGLKILGDPNVPAGELTIKADLNRPMLLNCEQQQKISTLKQIDTPDLPPEMTLDKIPEQPFRLPTDCTNRYDGTPEKCQYRYHSLGHIAGHDFSNPSFISSHWIIFDQDTFGHIWIKLRSMSVYSRITEYSDS